MFLVAACLCIVFTLLVKIGLSSLDTRPQANMAHADDGKAQSAALDKSQAVAKLGPFKKPLLGKSSVVPPDRQKPRTLAAEEVAALSASKPPVLAPPHQPPGHDRLVGRQNPRFGRNPELREVEKYTQDPATGAWFTKNNLWQVREKYRLPIDSEEMRVARLSATVRGLEPLIEMQWWYPRAVNFPEKHRKGKVARLRFLALATPAQIQRAEDHVRVVNTRGWTADGRVLVEAEATIYSTRLGQRGRGFDIWNLAGTNVKENPSWFRDGERSIKKGSAGKLPAWGREIELVRKAVQNEEEDAQIREVKWWAPRLNRFVHHRMSKLRYEVNRDGIIRLEEIVFDYNRQKATLAQVPTNLFPEYDRHTLRLEQVPR
jgi:hypothetical protein